jgi:hypothetical protein
VGGLLHPAQAALLSFHQACAFALSFDYGSLASASPPSSRSAGACGLPGRHDDGSEVPIKPAIGGLIKGGRVQGIPVVHLPCPRIQSRVRPALQVAGDRSSLSLESRPTSHYPDLVALESRRGSLRRPGPGGNSRGAREAGGGPPRVALQCPAQTCVSTNSTTWLNSL